MKLIAVEVGLAATDLVAAAAVAVEVVAVVVAPVAAVAVVEWLVALVAPEWALERQVQGRLLAAEVRALLAFLPDWSAVAHRPGRLAELQQAGAGAAGVLPPDQDHCRPVLRAILVPHKLRDRSA